MKPLFFADYESFRAWLESNHNRETELWVGFHKKTTGLKSITWPESVDAALCFGWIDGLRKKFDDKSYVIRFTPRKPGSNWSAVNIKRVQDLEREGMMRAAGRQAFAKRLENKSGIYSYEQRHTIQLDSKLEKHFRAEKKAWDFFNQQPPGYRKLCIYWIMSAKRKETREKRLNSLIEDSRNHRRLKQLERPGAPQRK
jgi:uncharacterized protein YdeI (YjbR/CyaY-like superfamily)